MLNKTVFVLLFGLCFTFAFADTISLKSGNAALTQFDPLISVRGADITVGGTAVPAAPVALQQARVRPKYQSWIVAPGNSLWVGLGTDSEYREPAGGYIYSMSFQLPSTFYVPSISMTATSDNESEVYLNGYLLGSVPDPYNYYTLNLSNPNAFKSGTNMLEIYLDNGFWGPGGHATFSGVAFTAEVNYSPTPEPMSILGVAGGVVGLLLKRRHQ